MANYPTPHINAKPEDFGKTVLMPGDPLRSKFIAENFLENPVLVNNVRAFRDIQVHIKVQRYPLWQAEWACPQSVFTATNFLISLA